MKTLTYETSIWKNRKFIYTELGNISDGVLRLYGSDKMGYNRKKYALENETVITNNSMKDLGES